MSAQVHRMNAFSFLEDERHFKLQKSLGNVSFQQLLGTQYALWSKKKDLVQGQAQLGFEPGTPDC